MSGLDRGLARLALPAAVAAVVVVVVGPTVMPGLGLWDTAEFQTVPPIMGTMHPTGYPTYVLLGFVGNLLLTPIGEPAFRMNVMSLLAVIVAAGVAALTIKTLTGRTLIAAAVGIGLALTPVAWAIATRADAHALHLAFVALLIALLARWEVVRGEAEDPPDAARRGDRWLLAAAVVYGLAAGNHSLTLLLALPILLYVLAVEPTILWRPRFVATCALAALATLTLVYLELPLRGGPFRAALVYANPETWGGFWYIALAEQFRGILGDPLADLPKKAAELAQLGVRELGLLAIVVPVGFLATLARAPRFALLTGGAFIITVLFNAAYTNADLSRYYLGPALIAWLWIGVFAATIVDGIVVIGAELGLDAEVVAAPAGRRRVLEIALSVVLAVGLLAPTAIAFRARSAAQDRSHDVTARLFLDTMFDVLPPNSVVISWWAYSTPLWYGQHIEGRRHDIKVIDDRTLLDERLGEAWDAAGRYLDERPVYVIRANGHDLGLILERFDLEALPEPALVMAGVWHVVGRRAAGG